MPSWAVMAPQMLLFAFPLRMGHMPVENPGAIETMKSGALTSVKLPADWSVETILPVDYQGRELMLEAHAYQGETDEEQILVARASR